MSIQPCTNQPPDNYSVHLLVCPSIHQPIHLLQIHQSIHPLILLLNHQWIQSSVCPPIHPSVHHPSTHQSTHPQIIHTSAHVSSFTPIYQSFHPPTHLSITNYTSLYLSYILPLIFPLTYPYIHTFSHNNPSIQP